MRPNPIIGLRLFHCAGGFPSAYIDSYYGVLTKERMRSKTRNRKLEHDGMIPTYYLTICYNIADPLFTKDRIIGLSDDPGDLRKDFRYCIYNDKRYHALLILDSKMWYEEIHAMSIWADRHIQQLKLGQTVSFRPRGNSMAGKIDNGDLVTVSPDIDNLQVGDAVLCSVGSNQYVHLIKAIDGDRYQIGNNRGRINGWVKKHAIYGKVISVSK